MNNDFIFKIKTFRGKVLKSFFLLFFPHIAVLMLSISVSTNPDTVLFYQLIWFCVYFSICLILYIIAPYIISNLELIKLGKLTKEEEKQVKELSKEEKMMIVFDTDEIKKALTLIHVMMNDIEAKNYVEYEYIIGIDKYKISVTKKEYEIKKQNELEEISDQHAIDFNEWVAINHYILSSDDMWYYMSDGNPDNGLTNIQLLKIYKEQKTLK